MKSSSRIVRTIPLFGKCLFAITLFYVFNVYSNQSDASMPSFETKTIRLEGTSTSTSNKNMVPSFVADALKLKGTSTSIDNLKTTPSFIAEALKLEGTSASADNLSMRPSFSAGKLLLSGTAKQPSFPKAGFEVEYLRLAGDENFSYQPTDETSEECKPPIRKSKTLFESETWLNINEPINCVDYIVDTGSRLTILSTLTIEAGVVIQVAPDVLIDVEHKGALIADGNEENPIVFTSSTKQEGDWTGIQIRSAAADNLLKHVIIEFAGGADITNSNYNAPANLVLNGEGNIRVEDSVFRKSAGHGFFVSRDTNIVSFTNNKSTNNVLSAGYMDVRKISSIGGGNSLSGNGANVLTVDALYSALEKSHQWQALDVTYFIKHDLGLRGKDAALVLNAGVSLNFATETKFDVRDGAQLTSVGTVEKPISLSSDSNAPWKGILVYDGTAEFAYTEIINAGSNSLALSNNSDKTAAVTIITFFTNQPPESKVFFGAGMRHETSIKNQNYFGVLFNNGGDARASGEGCKNMTPIFRFVPNSSGQCDGF